MACGFQRGGALDEEDLKGNSPRLLWVPRGLRLGLAAVDSSSVRRWSVAQPR
jgi:hypothetical protein